ncbi:tripartite tricarboxylate transporter substrate binding protein [Variovorax paradoxus]|nr:tripartite tricarboxylate transporter substrate binding protein [Variovorax paradoxus]MBT2304685.1 tripartite tricarboxylate transporter substrate binding protein [Variovorax paradoxus]
MTTRKLLGGLAITAALGYLCSTAFAAETYPSRPIKVILPFATGGQSDVVARLIAERMAAGLGQPLVVENVAGAGGMIAAANVARAAPDGYTIFLANASTLTIAPYLQKRATVDPAAFTPITTVSQFPLVLVVNSNSPYKSLADVVAGAKAKPDKMSFASPGYGTTPHLMGETLMREANISITHVPYKGGGPALNDLLGGQVDLFFEAPATLLPQIHAGKLRPLAVTSKTRMPSLPEVRTVAEQGMPKLMLESWSAFVAPAGTPADIIKRLRVETEKVLKSEGIVSKLRERGFEATSSTPEELARMIRDEGRTWSQLIKERNITVD